MWYLIVSIPDLCTLTYFDCKQNPFQLLVSKHQNFERGSGYLYFQGADTANWCIHQNTYVMSPIWFKRRQKRKEKKLVYMPSAKRPRHTVIVTGNSRKKTRRPEVLIGADMSHKISLTMFDQVMVNLGLLLLTYFARPNVQMRHTDPTT